MMKINNYQLILLITICINCVYSLSSSVKLGKLNVVTINGLEKKNRTNFERRRLLFGNKLYTKCGIQLRSLEGRIVGGREADYGEFPWQVSLQLKRRLFGLTHFCGGTVIGNNWILTAAHCAVHFDSNNTIAVLGTNNLSPFHNNVKSQLESTFIHPNYSSTTIENDIALIKTTDPIDLSTAIYPITAACLPDSYRGEQLTGRAIVTGFGRTSESNSVSGSPVLRVTEVPLMSLETCRSYYGSRVYPKMLCAGFKEGKHDSCQGDSGGPLVQLKNGHGVIIGVVSWGIGCARPERPGVYTKVSSYLDWIYNTIEDNQ
ncbi:trypsin-1-like [Panonychus citri]|uniref:trypsin-1-like n=1 Tax=Panonychus citri TaxID=50023 RepID=UPI00230782EB|nr:trypsin-1-like [Panonychus citri]XP_053215007.1 trypsin-1-like [Panonychus citri]